MNVRLIYIFQFFRQFRFDVKHKFDKKHIILNVLSRLIVIIKSILFDNYAEFDILYIYIIQILNYDGDESLYVYFVILIKINKAFRKRFLYNYAVDSH